MQNNETTASQILEREFKAATGTTVKANFDDINEIILLESTITGDIWVMQIGSDDDKLTFHCEATGSTISFDYPDDWPA